MLGWAGCWAEDLAGELGWAGWAGRLGAWGLGGWGHGGWGGGWGRAQLAERTESLNLVLTGFPSELVFQVRVAGGCGAAGVG